MRKRGIWALILISALASCRREGPAGPPLVISLPYRVDTLDPHAVNAMSYFAAASHIYDTLVTTDADMRILPSLAARWENPDPRTWIFHLRPDVRFQSGRPLTAADVVYSFDRVLKNPRLEMAGYLTGVAAVQPMDPLAVRVRTASPMSLLLAELRFLAIVPEGSTAESLAAKPDGTGPYRVALWRKGRLLRLVRNDRYWSKPPGFGSVELRFGREPEQAARDSASGQAQIAVCDSRRLVADLPKNGNVRVLRRTSFFIVFLGFDLARNTTPYVQAKSNPFLDPRVRQAIDIGISRARIAAEIPTFAVPADQLVPPFIHGYDPRIAAPPHDPAAARRLLAEAGYPGGFRARLDVRDIYSDAAEIVRQELASIGIQVTPNRLDAREYFDRMSSRDTSLALRGLGCPTGDIADILDNAIHSADPARHLGLHNFEGYSDPALDRAIEKSAGIDDEDTRSDALQRITSLVMKERPLIPLYFDEDVYLVGPGISWRPRADSMVLAAEAAPAEEAAGP